MVQIFIKFLPTIPQLFMQINFQATKSVDIHESIIN